MHFGKKGLLKMNRYFKGVSFGFLLLFIFLVQITGAKEAAPVLKSISISPLTVNPNLIPNYSFVSVGPNGVPIDWSWDKRNTDATFTLLDTLDETGDRTLYVTNHTPFGANVYGTMWTNSPIHLKPNTLYTLSCWESMNEPTVAWVGGGDNWRIRMMLPNTYGHWKHVSMTFTADDAEADFTLRVNTDGVTHGFKLRDMKLEEGDQASLTIPQVKVNHPLLWLIPQDQINADLPWSIPAAIYSTEPIKNAALRIIMTWENHIVNYSQKVSIQQGLSQIVLHGAGSGSALMKPEFQFSLLRYGEQHIISASSIVSFYSSDRIRKQLLALQKRVPSLLNIMHKVSKKGQDAAYPLVNLTILQNLPSYAIEMVDHQQIQRAASMLAQLIHMYTTTKMELDSMLVGILKYQPVPRYAGGPVHIDGSSFMANTRIPGKKKLVMRPVIFTGFGHFDQARMDIPKFPGYGFNIIQEGEFGPSSVFPKDGVTSDACVKVLQTELQNASKAGVAVDFMSSAHYMPDWALQKYPDLKVKRDGFLQYSLYAPEGNEILKQYYEYVIPQIANYPALLSVCLTNEPVNLESPDDPYAQQDWHQWLSKKYATIDNLNAKWDSSYPTFDAVALPDPFNPPPPSPLWYEFNLFNQHFFSGWHKTLADDIHKAAPKTLIHAKAMTWTMLNSNAVQDGINAELFGDFSQINGNDSSDNYNDGSGEWADGWQLNNMAYDLQHSVRNAPIFNSENHLMPDRGESYVPPEHLRCALWQEAIHGQCATAIWTWQKTFDPHSDFWGLAMERPDCVAAIGHTALDLMRLAPEVTAFQNIKPQVQFLITTSARVYDGDDYTDCLNKAYTAISFTGLKAGFITGHDLEAGVLPSAPLLMIPNICHLSEQALQGIEKYHGKVLLIGEMNVLGFDEYGKPQSHPDYPHMDFTRTKTTSKELWRSLLPYLSSNNINPSITIRDAHKKPVWGVEWLCAKHQNKWMINLANHLNISAKFQILKNGAALKGKELISGNSVNEWITLKPMQTAIIRLK
jgi:hypothetical protein